MMPPRPPHHLVRTTPSTESNEPRPLWSQYFRDQDLLSTKEGNQFNCYFGGPWNDPPPGSPLLICFHGAGHTGLSFALLSKLVEDHYVTAAFDMRHHGLTRCSEEDDLSVDRLVDDGVAVVEAVNAKVGGTLPLVLCGHSLGGAIAARVAERLESQGGLRVFAVMLLDILEGLALEALPQNEIFLQKYPKSFPDLDAAIGWSLKTILRSRESASLSIPSQLMWNQETRTWYAMKGLWNPYHYRVWRVDLASTSRFWRGWFEGLTAIFLGLKASKVLILAGTPHDRLDNQMTIAYMQGKFQLISLPKTGHIIQEDQSQSVAHTLIDFAERCKKLLRTT
eukprot:Protomagalhaensia_sp_Gyna_25__576@NODE_1270_length_1994_cov_695_013811_g1012_i0_p1_GENE_NODE_1270_length_1994_cov_695_013811_g1012_i0NODE_1270_length_1994_cov_695_013811_g1012_i0_p1_ORF_typecomplete_len337_score54_15Abhydrolase_6/PF12697_7/8_7e29Hydrolase_4/PF12146_8/7_6e18Thioesterase/PF00975_20/2_5e15Abhydrolase_1/PF00561_20/7_4e12Abhydrolase_2/PF02230_16/1_3e05Chlorophyllase2/PF12740_7/3_9e05Peptidase_S15/PF02129_18/7_7e05Lipase_3/PF01764_25/7_4e05AXE1/PF05448_12/0_00033DUF818/PF05677_12/0_00